MSLPSPTKQAVVATDGIRTGYGVCTIVFTRTLLFYLCFVKVTSPHMLISYLSTSYWNSCNFTALLPVVVLNFYKSYLSTLPVPDVLPYVILNTNIMFHKCLVFPNQTWFLTPTCFFYTHKITVLWNPTRQGSHRGDHYMSFSFKVMWRSWGFLVISVGTNGPGLAQIDQSTTWDQ